MKSIRVLLALSAFAVVAGLASANCGTCEKKEACDKTDKACAGTCEKAKEGYAKDCDKPCCKKDDAKMTCCEEAAKAGKACEKCNPPEKK